MEKFIMKKQLIAAAVATSVSAIAMADISITGSLKTNYTHKDYQTTSKTDTDNFSTEGNLYFKGKSGDTSVVMNLGGIDTSSAGAINQAGFEDVYLTTKVGDVNVKMGNYDNGDATLRASSRTPRFSASTELGGFGLSYLNGNGVSQATSNAQDDEVGISTSLGGVNLSYTVKDGGETIKASTSVGGINVSYMGLPSDTADSDRALIELSTELQGVGIKVGSASAETGTTINGDSWMGDFEGTVAAGTAEHTMLVGQDVTAVELSTNVAGNKVAFRNINVDGYSSANYDWSMNKIIVTRPLASGATLEVTYKDISDDASTLTDVEVLDIELAVAF
jgi:hypothetical protein